MKLMKKIILFIALIVSSVAIQAQDANYNGPAKTQVKTFWGKIEMLKQGKSTGSSLMAAKNLLKSAKEKDPSYNTSAMETELKIWEDKAAREETERQKTNDQLQAANEKADDDLEYFKSIWTKMVSLYSEDDDMEGMPYGSEYYEAIKELDLEGYKKRKEELNGKEFQLVAKLDAMFKDYDNFIERAGIIKNLRPANTSEANTPAEKKEMLTEMKMECQAVLLISPNNTAAKEKLVAVNKALGASDAEVSKFFTSDFHKENYNKIVWSTKPLIIGKEKEMAAFIKTAFKTGEPIFGTVYLGRNIKDAQNDIESLPVRIEVDGSNTITGDGAGLIVPVAVQGKSYFQFALLPDAQWIKDNYAKYVEEVNETYPRFMDVLVRNGEDKHDVSFELNFRGIGAEEIKSTFSLDLSSGLSEIKMMAAQLHAVHFANIKLPKAGMSNPVFEQKMLSAANGLGWKDKFTKIIITSKDWATRKNDLTGAILYRSLDAIAITKDIEGKCYYQEFGFRQDYSGGGNYESAIKYNGYAGKREIGCDKIK
jgi:hypothetical protein